MSRAFVKEGDGALDPLPDLPLSPHPNYVTPRGLVALQARLAARQADLAALKARPDRLDKLPEAAAERDIRYLEARLRSAIPVPVPDQITEVAFGHRVTVRDDTDRETRYEITGEDEADATLHRIAPCPCAAGGDAVLARAAPSPRLHLAVLQANPRGRAFWQRHGFTDTGLCDHDAMTGHTLHRMVKPL